MFAIPEGKLSLWQERLPHKLGLTKNSRFCQRHFTEHDIVKGRFIGEVFHENKLWRLKKDVFPSLHLGLSHKLYNYLLAIAILSIYLQEMLMMLLESHWVMLMVNLLKSILEIKHQISMRNWQQVCTILTKVQSNSKDLTTFSLVIDISRHLDHTYSNNEGLANGIAEAEDSNFNMMPETLVVSTSEEHCILSTSWYIDS